MQQESIRTLYLKVQELWGKMCQEDGLPTDKFVVFSPDNKYTVPYNEAMTKYMDACREAERQKYGKTAGRI